MSGIFAPITKLFNNAFRLLEIPYVRQMIFTLAFYLVIALVIFAAILVYIYFWTEKRVDDLDKKYVLLATCESDVGRRAAQMLDGSGMHVIACCSTQKGIDKVKRMTSDRTVTLLMDVTDRESIERAKDKVLSVIPEGVGLWGLVNNAAITGPLVAPWSRPEDYQRVMDVNFHGVVEVTHAFLPLIKEARGRIVNISTCCGRFSMTGVPYNVSKFPLEAYTDGLRRSLRDYGIRVGLIESGFVSRPKTSEYEWTNNAEKCWEGLSDEEREEYGKEYKVEVINRLTTFADYYHLFSINHTDMAPDAITHGVTAVNSFKRYHTGLDAHMFHLPISNLPDSITDRLVRKMYPVKPAAMFKL